MNTESEGTWSGYRIITFASSREEPKLENVFATSLLVAKKEELCFCTTFWISFAPFMTQMKFEGYMSPSFRKRNYWF